MTSTVYMAVRKLYWIKSKCPIHHRRHLIAYTSSQWVCKKQLGQQTEADALSNDPRRSGALLLGGNQDASL